MNVYSDTETATVQKTADTLLDKPAVARLCGMRSTRWVDLQLAKGMPHLRVGARRTRFERGEVLQWLRRTYGA